MTKGNGDMGRPSDAELLTIAGFDVLGWGVIAGGIEAWPNNKTVTVPLCQLTALIRECQQLRALARQSIPQPAATRGNAE